MKIENKNESQDLGTTNFGSCIKLDGVFYILTSEGKDPKLILVNLETGYPRYESMNTQIEIVNAKVVIE